jgi:hypothetical protein
MICSSAPKAFVTAVQIEEPRENDVDVLNVPLLATEPPS